jgi:hypothetical protein
VTLKLQLMLTFFLVSSPPLLAQAQSVQVPSGRNQSPPLAWQQRFDQVRERCANAAKARGLNGYDFDRSIRSCFIQDPDVVARQRECQKEALARGLAGRDFRPFIRRCMTD